jgi:pimeloyl-ACP methyl ester carboxylesterase
VLHAGLRGRIASLAVMASVSRPGRLLPHDVLEQWRKTGVLHTDEGDLGYGFIEDARNHDVLAAAGRITCPSLFIHGSADDVVPEKSSHDLWACVRAEKRIEVLEGADHVLSDPGHRQQALDLILDWL